jgi:hypothetical protein
MIRTHDFVCFQATTEGQGADLAGLLRPGNTGAGHSQHIDAAGPAGAQELTAGGRYASRIQPRRDILDGLGGERFALKSPGGPR